MSLRPLFSWERQGVGVFDGYDNEVNTFKGGEVVTLRGVPLGTDLAAADADGSDGYVLGPPQVRTVATKALLAGSKPLYLADEGMKGYGTLFGTVVGATTGQVVAGGAVLGPHTTAGSGKVTCWLAGGMFGVSLDAVDQDPTTGLQPTNPTLVVGAPLYATVDGVLTPDAGEQFDTVVVARFVNFSTNGSLVTTPSNLAGYLRPVPLTEAVINFAPEY